MMKKNLNVIKGEITDISSIITIERQQKSSFRKVTVGVMTEDGQLIFFEVRDVVKGWDAIKVGEQVSISYYFAGSIKDDKLYNNIIAKFIN